MHGDDRGDLRTLGEILQECRTRRGLSLEDVSEATKISPKMLHALEHDEIDQLAGPIYARGFVKTLAAFFQQDEQELLSRLESLDRHAAPVEIPVHLSEDDEEPVETPAPAPETAPEEPVTWRVETVGDTAVKRVVGGGRMGSLHWVWVVLVVLAAIFLVRWLAGGKSSPPEEPGVQSSTSSSSSSLPAATPQEETGMEVVEPKGVTLDDAVPQPSSPRIDLEHAILAGASPEEPPSTASGPAAGEGSAPSRAAPREVESPRASRPSSRETDRREASLKEADTARASPPPAGSGLGSIVRPGVQPPIAGQMRLELIALDQRVEVWASADGSDLQHRVLQPNESWSLLGRDHFSLRLPRPKAVVVKLDGVVRIPPRGLRGEWIVYPSDETH